MTLPSVFLFVMLANEIDHLELKVVIESLMGNVNQQWRMTRERN